MSTARSRLLQRLRADRTTWRLTAGFAIFYVIGTVMQLVSIALWKNWTVPTFVEFIAGSLLIDAVGLGFVLALALRILRLVRTVRGTR